jgi:hypothetical protein
MDRPKKDDVFTSKVKFGYEYKILEELPNDKFLALESLTEFEVVISLTLIKETMKYYFTHRNSKDYNTGF